MNGLLALSLTLLLGQTPSPSATQGASQQPATEEEAALAVREAELEELRAQIELLQAQLEARQQENQNRLQTLEQQDATKNARAEQLEQLRQQSLASLERGYDWLITVDQLLETGDLSVGPALSYAQQELASALANSTDIGRGETARLIERALNRISALEALVEERDIFPARLQLWAAGFELNQARRLNLQREGTTLVNQ